MEDAIKVEIKTISTEEMCEIMGRCTDFECTLTKYTNPTPQQIEDSACLEKIFKKFHIQYETI